MVLRVGRRLHGLSFQGGWGGGGGSPNPPKKKLKMGVNKEKGIQILINLKR